MTLDQQVTSLPLSQRLDQLGVKQDGLFSWYCYDHNGHKEEYVLRGTGGGVTKRSKMYQAFTVAELGEMLPTKILAETINATYPMPTFLGNETGDAWDEVDSAQEAAREKLSDVLSAFDGDTYDQFQDGQPYDLRLNYAQGRHIIYYQLSDDYENNVEMIDVSGNTEADARAKMLIYLLENKLITL